VNKSENRPSSFWRRHIGFRGVRSYAKLILALTLTKQAEIWLGYAKLILAITLMVFLPNELKFVL